MKITDLLRPEGIKIGAVAKDKMDAINQLIDLRSHPATSRTRPSTRPAFSPARRRAQQLWAKESPFRTQRQTLSSAQDSRR